MQKNSIAFTGFALTLVVVGCGSAETGDEADNDSALEGLHARSGAVFTSTNDATGNEILAFARRPDGSLAKPVAYATLGLGTGSGLGSQGALALSEDHRLLLAVDAGSNELTSFQVEGARLRRMDHVPSGGTRPISVTLRNGIAYVLNAGGTGSVNGFRIGHNGRVYPIPGATRGLSAAGTGPAQVELSPDGRHLVVTEKATNKIDTYEVDNWGRLGDNVVRPSAGLVPFGFEFTRSGYLIVSEAASGSLSSYAFSRHDGFEVRSGAVPDNEVAPCWVTISVDDHFAFTANAGSGSISAYEVDARGHLTLKDARAGVTGVGSKPLDLTFGGNGNYLYVLDGGRNTIASFSSEKGGALGAPKTYGELPASSAGLVAY